jgi:hypothetical protein
MAMGIFLNCPGAGRAFAEQFGEELSKDVQIQSVDKKRVLG